MAQRKIAFPVVYKKNMNETSTAFGKYYPEAYPPQTLSLRGLIERVAFEQSVYSRDIVEGVIQRLTKVMVELLTGGQPVKWDGLGTFVPKIESAKGGVTAGQHGMIVVHMSLHNVLVAVGRFRVIHVHVEERVGALQPNVGLVERPKVKISVGDIVYTHGGIIQGTERVLYIEQFLDGTVAQLVRLGSLSYAL